MQVARQNPPAQGLILDEADEFMARYIDCDEHQRHALVLFAAATHAIRVFPTFPHVLLYSEEEESGKTLAMNVTGYLASRNISATGTGFALDAALLEASQQPELPVPTVTADEISDLFGRDGFGGRRGHPLVRVLREGYKRGATSSVSRRGVRTPFSLYVPVIMTGLRTAIPRDIRTRSIVIKMQQGSPQEYFDVRDAETQARAYGEALAFTVQQHVRELSEFRARTLGIPQLKNRKMEVWEPLFAVALALGGAKWLAYCTAAFKALALAEMSQAPLTPRQALLRDVAEMGEKLTLGDGFVPGLALADEMRHADPDRPQTQASMAKLISNAMPVNTVQRTLPSGQKVRGYWLADIREAWEAVRPPTLDELEAPEEENPFEVNDDEEPEAPGTGGTGGTGKTAQPAVPDVPAPVMRPPGRPRSTRKMPAAAVST